jgi:hypothetical protein
MKGSKQDLPVAVALPDGSSIKQVEWGGMSIELGSFVNHADPTPFFVGLPDDRCQCPHWGYVITGELSFAFADRVEVFRAGEVYHVGPGHVPMIGEQTEYIEFSPADQIQATMEIVGRNLQAAGIA